jgi:hypothetical protein
VTSTTSKPGPEAYRPLTIAAVPENSMASSTFGQILSDVSGNNGLNPGNQRILQIVAKFVF